MAKKISQKERVVRTLQDYINILPEIETRDSGNNWKTYVREVLIKALGKESSFVNTLDNTHFTKKIDASKWEFDPKKREAFRTLLAGSIEHIESFGLNENYNWLHNFSNIKLLSGALSLATGIWWFGQWCGERWEKTEKSEEYSKLYNDYKILERDHRDLKVFYNRLKSNEDSARISVYRGISIRDKEIDSLKSEIRSNKVKLSNSPNSHVQIGTNNKIN